MADVADDRRIEHVVASGDTLASLAKRYYGNENEAYWMRIYHANATSVRHAALGVDPKALEPGTKLTILPPPLPGSMHFEPIGPEYGWKFIDGGWRLPASWDAKPKPVVE
jgi:hypothetical protein